MMNPINLTINGREVTGLNGQTVRAIAAASGIVIPTLCFDNRIEPHASCGICVVEAEGSPRLLRACSTPAAEGMVIHTNTERVRRNRKIALELLLSDHTGDCKAPCALACPAQTDCQGYVGLVANGAYQEAYQRITEKIPLPASIGRVCPHPCEEACRRELVEEPVSIAALKRAVGDWGLNHGQLTMDPEPLSGKTVGIIGGGPGGLSAAYFLRRKGHAVRVYDAMPHMGGMLRYGIPEYRLPNEILQKEIEIIAAAGVELRNNVRVGKDITLGQLRKTHDAVIVAAGAWVSMALGCPGEELGGVVGGIEFLRGAFPLTGKVVAIVGGGNTAMDACRTAVRLGAAAVYNIYRRTRAEMPAEEIEIAEAEEEGVVFKNLTNPIEISSGPGGMLAIRLQIMELGEPDASGRRAPVPVPGKEETLAVDIVVAAIGQKFDPAGFEGLALTRRGNLAADEHTFATNLEGVFAIGDATKGTDLAISAIADAAIAADAVDAFLRRDGLTPPVNRQCAEGAAPYLSKTEKTADDFAGREKTPRFRAPHRAACDRRTDFGEIGQSLSQTDAKREAARCLECGCMDYYGCKLLEYANEYGVQPERFNGKTHRCEPRKEPHLHRNPEKCILCGLCVRLCEEVERLTSLGFAGRGFDTTVKPALGKNLKDTTCNSCGKCAEICPTGAFVRKGGKS
jgi:formate dehydrogenase major subunit